MLIGYARVSTQDQHPDFQLDALKAAGCEQVFQEKMTGKLADRPELVACLRTLRKGDILVVWKLDRLGRSLKHLVEIIHDLEQRGVAFRSLTESIDTASAGGKLIFHVFGALAEFEHSLIRERHAARSLHDQDRGGQALQGLAGHPQQGAGGGGASGEFDRRACMLTQHRLDKRTTSVKQRPCC